MMLLRQATVKRSARLALRAAGIAGAAFLAACGANSTYMPARTGYLEETPPVTAALTSLTYRVDLGRGQTALTRAQIDGLNRFLAASGETDGDHIEIRTAVTAGPGRNAAIAGTLRDSFLVGGVAPSRVRIVEAPAYGDAIEVAIQRYTVRLPDCSGELDPDNASLEWSDEPVGVRKIGCTTQHNLGMMIADPRDLQGGRELEPAKAYREVGAVQRYRTDKVKELEDVSSK